MKRRTFELLLAISVFVPFTSIAVAQKGAGGGGGGQKKGGKGAKFGGGGGRDRGKENQRELEGEVKQITPQGLLIESSDGVKYLVGVAEDSRVTFSGPASREFLKPGQLVEFEVELDRAMRPVGEVKVLTFVDASPLNPIGLFPTGASERQGREEAARFLARGKLLPPRDGQLVAQVGQKNLVAPLAADTSLDARFGNWLLAVSGDSVTGTVVVPPQANTGVLRGVAAQLEITSERPIEPKKKTMAP